MRFAARALAAASLLSALMLAIPDAAFAYPQCHAVQGTVRDPYGAAVGLASVHVDNPCVAGPDALSDPATGRYAVNVLGTDAGGMANVQVSKTNYATTTQTVYIEPGAGQESASPQSPSPTYRVRGSDVTLFFDVVTTLDRPAVHSGSARTVSVSTLAPPPGDPSGHASRVLVEVPGGGFGSLPYQGASAGLFTYQATITMPVGTLEGSHQLKVCAVDNAYGSSCTAAAGVTAPTRVSAVRLKPILVDDHAPVLSALAPGAFDVTQARTVSSTWSDLDTDLDSTAVRVSVDGVQLTPTVVGLSAQASTLSIPAGVHRLSIEVADRAGNQTSTASLFTITDVSASAATATVVSQQLNVINSTDPTLATVRFLQPQVDVTAFTETIAGSSRVGLGTVSRSVSFTPLTVRFRNEVGQQEDRAVGVPGATTSHEIAVVAPSTQSMLAGVPATTMSLANLTAPVPVNFRTPGSTATLLARTVSLGSSTFAGPRLVTSDFVGKAQLIGDIGVCASGIGTSVSRCTLDSRAGAQVVYQNRQIPVYYSAVGEASASDLGASVQACTGCSQPGPISDPILTASFTTGCPILGVSTVTYDVCTGQPTTQPAHAGPFSAFINAAVYREADGNRFPLWRQDHAISQSAPCANGKSGSAVGGTHRLIANTSAADGSTGAITGGTWDDPDNRRSQDEIVYLGTQTGNNRESAVDNLISFQLSNTTGPTLEVLQTGFYIPAQEGFLSASDGSTSVSASTVSNGWEIERGAAPLGGGYQGNLKIFNGTEFRNVASNGTFSLHALLGFSATIDYSSCS